MSRHLLVLFPLLILPAAASAQTVDTSGAGAIIAEARDHSEVMANLRTAGTGGRTLSGDSAEWRLIRW